MRWLVVSVIFIVVFLQALAFAQEDSSSRETGSLHSLVDSPKNWVIEISLENGVEWQAKDYGRAHVFGIKAIPEWTFGQFVLGAEITAVGERNTENVGFALNDTLFYAKYAAYDGGGFVLGPKLDFTVPTSPRAREDEGFRGAPGIGLYAEWNSSIAFVEWESNIARAWRNEVRDEVGDPLLSFSRFTMFHEVKATFPLFDRFDIAQRFRWTRSWQIDREKNDAIISEQLVGYEWNAFRVELGHLFERDLRLGDGTRKSIALASPAESQWVGNLIFLL